MLVVFFFILLISLLAHHLVCFTFEVLYELFKYIFLVQVLNVIPINGGAPPKFSQRTQLITDNYQVVWQVICYWIMSILKMNQQFSSIFFYLLLSKSEICDAGLVIFTDMDLFFFFFRMFMWMFPSLYILGYCIFATYSTFQLLSSPDSVNLFFAIQMLVCHNQSNFFLSCSSPYLCSSNGCAFFLFQLCPKFEYVSIVADIPWVRLN